MDDGGEMCMCYLGRPTAEVTVASVPVDHREDGRGEDDGASEVMAVMYHSSSSSNPSSMSACQVLSKLDAGGGGGASTWASMAWMSRSSSSAVAGSDDCSGSPYTSIYHLSKESAATTSQKVT